MAQKKKAVSAKQSTRTAAKTEPTESAAAEKKITISAEDLDKLQQQLEDYRNKAAEAEDKQLRSMAELENFRKRKEKERLEHIKYANESLIAEIIPIMNNFDLAFTAAEKNPATHNFAVGVEMILNQMKELLQSYGVSEINPLGQPFNPHLHEAIEHQETQETCDDVVVEVVKKGYMLHERVIQPAVVKTAGKAAEPAPEDTAPEPAEE